MGDALLLMANNALYGVVLCYSSVLEESIGTYELLKKVIHMRTVA